MYKVLHATVSANAKTHLLAPPQSLLKLPDSSSTISAMSNKPGSYSVCVGKGVRTANKIGEIS